MLHSMIRTTALLSLLACGTASAEDTPCEERVASDCSWASRYPFNTIGLLTWTKQNGNTGIGTAFLVSPHCALTNGHLVYQRNQGRFIEPEQTFSPGACRSSCCSSGWFRSQLGSRTVHRKRTNNKYADTTYNPKMAVDYGAVQIVCPFSEITTFMPLCFGYESNWAHMTGYPLSDLPDTSESFNQWVAYGDVIDSGNRWVRYDAKSTGGASGSPVWNWRNDSHLTDVFAINSTHWDSCDGGGPRLVWQNENLIRTWMQWEPSGIEKMLAGCMAMHITPWPDLIQYFQTNEELRLKAEEVRIENPIAPPPTGPSRRYMQVIEGGFYEWVAYDLQPGNPESNQLIQLLSAPGVELPNVAWTPGMDFDPQTQGWLSVEHGTALLSGSAGRATAPVTGIEAIDIEIINPEVVEQPAPDAFDGHQDFSQDGEGPTEQDPCFGDLNNDGKIDGGDLGMLLAMWGQCIPGANCDADLNGDGRVDGADLGLMLGVFGDCL